MSPRGTLTAIVEELADALDPLVHALEDDDAFVSLMRFLGWNATGVIQPVKDLGALVAGARELAAEGLDPARTAELVGRLRTLYETIRGLSTISAGALPAGIDLTEFRDDFPRELLDFLVVEHLRHRRPKIGRLLELFGILRLHEVAATPTRPDYVRREIDWSAFVDALRVPAGPFRTAYRFAQSDFDGQTLLDVAYEFLRGHGLNAHIGILSAAEREFLRQGAPASATAPIHNSVIRWFVADNAAAEPPIAAGLGLAITPETPTHKPGFAILPFVEGSSSATFLLTPSVTAEFRGEFSMAGGVSLRVRPDVPPQLDVGISGGAATGAVELGVGIDLLNTGGTRRILVGEPESSRLEVGKLAIRGGTRVQSGSGATAFVEVEAKDGSLVIAPNEEEADGFLTSILPKQWSLDFAATIGFDAENGLYFTGSSGLEIQLPAHIALGPLELKSAQIAVRPRNDAGDSSIPIELTGTISADLGLLKGTIENVGVRAELIFREGGGELGPLDFSLGFRPPSGVGLLVNTPLVRGGGYLFLDPEKGEYAGVLELSLFNTVTLQAVGLITTRMPDGTRGFSLLIILTAEFGTGIQLGLGFTLLAVGGLLGHNRTMRLDALALGIRTGAINSVLFPRDVVANAPRIISDLRAIFPPRQGIFLIGPMVKLAWGTPALVTLSLGVLIEVPGNVAIVGVLRIVLPNEDAPLIVMQASFIGALEFDRDRVWFFAALFESRFVWLPVDGEMGVLGAYGDDDDLVVSIGGFHPRFEAPELPFPTPKRVSIALLNQPNARIAATLYLAVTTNTCQIGGRITLYYGFSFAKLDGELGVDAIFQFTPFKYEAVVSGSVSFKVFGVGLFSIRLELTLEGPGPNRVRGKGKVSLLFVSFSANFSVTWGEILEFFAPLVDVLRVILRELEKAESWLALVPPRNTLLVSMRAQEPPVGGVLLHPVGTLRVSQRAVPLDLALDKVGNTTPADGKRFSLRVRGGGLVKSGDAEEKFAPAQFREMSDADKLSSPAFQPEHAGIELTAPGEEARTSRAVQRTVRYEEIIIDSNFRRASNRFGVRGSLLFSQLLAGGAVARSSLSEKRKRELAPFAERVSVDDGGYVVAFTSDNKPASAGARFASAVAAQDFMAREVARDPSLRERLHVIPGFEMNDAA